MIATVEEDRVAYCKHSLSDCDECKPTDYADCYFCGRPTPTWIEDNDDSVGYKGRLYYCEQHEHLIYD